MDSGYGAWLLDEIKARAETAFEAADSNDVEALKRARSLYDAAVIVDSIIKDSAR